MVGVLGCGPLWESYNVYIKKWGTAQEMGESNHRYPQHFNISSTDHYIYFENITFFLTKTTDL